MKKQFTKQDAFKVAEDKGYSQALKDVKKLLDDEHLCRDDIKQQLKELEKK